LHIDGAYMKNSPPPIALISANSYFVRFEMNEMNNLWIFMEGWL